MRGRTAESLSAAFAGALFAVGLAVGGMTDPANVIGFLDITGDWDPRLAFVMGGALMVYAPLRRWRTKGPMPRFADRFHLPTRHAIDAPLLAGAALFGAGWGLAGFCPGPALTSVGAALVGGPRDALIFSASMLVGMFLYGAFGRYQAARRIERLRA